MYCFSSPNRQASGFIIPANFGILFGAFWGIVSMSNKASVQQTEAKMLAVARLGFLCGRGD